MARSSFNGKQPEKHIQKISNKLLITPSASPPSKDIPSHPLAKRPRLTATPSSSSSSTPFSRHTPLYDTPDDVQDARKASSMRVLDAWAQLAERYNRRLDEDDVVDLWSGAIIEDRGVIRGTAQREMGRLPLDGPETFGEDTNNEDHDQNDPEDDDELDPSVSEPDISHTFVAERINGNVPPIRGMESADQDDLKEFLEAEKQRQDLYAEDHFMSKEELKNLRKVLAERDKEHSDKESEDGNTTERGGKEDDSSDVEITQTNFDAYTDDESDDELGIWERDEASALYQVPSDPEQEGAARIGTDTIDTSDSPTPSPPLSPPPILSPKRRPVPRQTIPKMRALPRSIQDSPVLEYSSSQLHTPPRSSSFLTENVPEPTNLPRTPSPLSFNPPPPTSPEFPTLNLGIQSRYSKSPEKVSQVQAKTPKKLFKPRLIPEVLITNNSNTPNPKEKVTRHTGDSEISHYCEAETRPDTPPTERLSASHKGKGRDMGRSDSKEPAARQCTAAEPHVDSGELPSQPSETTGALPRGRKRKRLPSPTVSEPPENLRSGATPVPESPVNQRHFDIGSPSGDRELINARYQDHEKRECPRSPSGAPSIYSSHVNAQYIDHGANQEGPRSHSRAPSIALPAPVFPPDHTVSPYYQYPYSQPPNAPHHTPTSAYAENPYSYPVNPMHAQYLLAQALHQLSFVMSASGHPQPPSMPPHTPYAHSAYPPPGLQSSSPWPPYTPTPNHLPQQARPFPHHSRNESSSSSSSSSLSSIPYMQPTIVPVQPYFNGITPSSSLATFPPSSPPPSSPSISTAGGSSIRPGALVRGRSKSRGRRVSFKLDDEHCLHSADTLPPSVAPAERGRTPGPPVGRDIPTSSAKSSRSATQPKNHSGPKK